MNADQLRKMITEAIKYGYAGGKQEGKTVEDVVREYFHDIQRKEGYR